MEPDSPAPPPEARLIRTAREAAGMTAAQAARATDGAVSATYWRDVERGYGGRRGRRAPARASARLLAVMARTTGGVTPDQLAAAQREDGARVLAEILRREGAAADTPPLRAVPSPAQEPGDSSAAEILAFTLSRHPDDEVIAAIAEVGARRGKSPSEVLGQVLRWLAFLDRAEGRPENGTSAG